ncbi:MAG: hypothetical protein OXF66_10280 [Gammaproteobacteria bacterium]|nr:hypothetical protein [Gammaproteobacteria bacterium]
MNPLLASALLALTQGPYSPAPSGQAPPDAPVWIAGQTVEEHAFRVTAEFQCPPEAVGEVLQVSISDTMARAEFSGEESDGRRELTLRVPGKQLQGLKPELFCPRPAAAEPRVLRLASRFTAQGALICSNAAGKKILAHGAVALDAWVLCPPAPAAAGPEVSPSGDPG